MADELITVTGGPAAAAAGLAPRGEAFSTFAKEGGRIGSGALGSGQGGVDRCVS